MIAGKMVWTSKGPDHLLKLVSSGFPYRNLSLEIELFRTPQKPIVENLLEPSPSLGSHPKTTLSHYHQTW